MPKLLSFAGMQGAHNKESPNQRVEKLGHLDLSDGIAEEAEVTKEEEILPLGKEKKHPTVEVHDIKIS